MLVKVLLWRKQGIKILVKANVPVLIKISILQQQQNILVFFPKFETISCHKIGWMGAQLPNPSECKSSYRSSRTRCSIKKVFLNISQKQKNHLCQRLFLNKFEGWGLQLYKENLTQMFSCEFCETSILLLSLNIFVSLDNLSSTFNGGELRRIP